MMSVCFLLGGPPEENFLGRCRKIPQVFPVNLTQGKPQLLFLPGILETPTWNSQNIDVAKTKNKKTQLNTWVTVLYVEKKEI